MVRQRPTWGRLTEEGCKQFTALHVIFPAGCAVVAATQVEEIEEVPLGRTCGIAGILVRWSHCRVKRIRARLIDSIDTQRQQPDSPRQSTVRWSSRDPIVENLRARATASNSLPEATPSPSSRGYNNGACSWIWVAMLAPLVRSSPLLLFCPSPPVLRATALYAVFARCHRRAYSRNLLLRRGGKWR